MKKSDPVHRQVTNASHADHAEKSFGIDEDETGGDAEQNADEKDRRRGDSEAVSF